MCAWLLNSGWLLHFHAKRNFRVQESFLKEGLLEWKQCFALCTPYLPNSQLLKDMFVMRHWKHFAAQNVAITFPPNLSYLWQVPAATDSILCAGFRQKPRNCSDDCNLISGVCIWHSQSKLFQENIVLHNTYHSNSREDCTVMYVQRQEREKLLVLERPVQLWTVELWFFPKICGFTSLRVDSSLRKAWRVSLHAHVTRQLRIHGAWHNTRTDGCSLSILHLVPNCIAGIQQSAEKGYCQHAAHSWSFFGSDSEGWCSLVDLLPTLNSIQINTCTQ